MGWHQQWVEKDYCRDCHRYPRRTWAGRCTDCWRYKWEVMKIELRAKHRPKPTKLPEPPPKPPGHPE